MHTRYSLAARPTNYQSYLVRLWRDQPYASWHASAQCVQTGTMHHFASVEQLTTFLERQAPDDPAQSPLALPVEQMDQGEKDDLQQADPLSGDKATLSASSTTVQEGTPQSRSFHREEHP